MFWTYPAVPCIDGLKEKHDNIEKKKREAGTSYMRSTPRHTYKLNLGFCLKSKNS